MSEVPDTPNELVRQKIAHNQAETIAVMQTVIQNLITLSETHRRILEAHRQQIEELRREVDDLKGRG